MKYIIRVLIVDCTSSKDVLKCRRDLISFCRIAHIRKPVLQNSPTEDSYAFDLTGLSEHTQLLWLHILSDLAALNAHYSVELLPLPDDWPIGDLP